MRRLIARLARPVTAIADWNRDTAEQAVLRASIDVCADPLRVWVRDLYQTTRDEVAA